MSLSNRAVVHRMFPFLQRQTTGIGLSAVLLIFLIQAGGPSARGQNADIDPDLQAAMSYDGEYNGGDLKKCNQTLAEKYYLKYLQHCTDSAERARVYSQLGALFNTDYQVRIGEKPNYDKARIYFAKALKAEPERIGLVTIRARFGMATPRQSAGERLRIRIDIYKWLSTLHADTPKDKLLLGDLGQRPKESDLRALIGLATQAQASAAANMLYEARRSADPIKSLELIVRELPGTKPAAAAQEKLDMLAGRHTTAVAVQKAKPIIASTAPSRVPSPVPVEEAVAAPPITPPAAPWAWIGAIILVCIAAVLALWLYRRRGRET